MAFPDLPHPVRLLHSEPRWFYPRTSSRIGGHAGLTVWECIDESLLAVVTETGEGISVTNGAEDIWRELVRQYGEAFTVLEHWPAGAGAAEEEHLDQVVVPMFGPPSWRRIWPVPETNPQHAYLGAWFTIHGRRVMDAVPAGYFRNDRGHLERQHDVYGGPHNEPPKE